MVVAGFLLEVAGFRGSQIDVGLGQKKY